MKVYADENNVNILQTIASASTLIGSLANVARDYIVSKFPEGYFKSIYIDTSETVVQQNRNAAHNTLANKIPYPSLSISPEISLDDPIGGMEKSMHLSSPNLYMRKDAIREYRKLVLDPDLKFSMMYTGDYITTNFHFKITTRTFIQNADVAFFLKSKFQENFFQYLNQQYLQTEIPKSFISFIAKLQKWNLDDPDDMEKMRLYLIGTGRRPEMIQKRKSLSTGKECFFLNDTCNLLTLVTDIETPSSINRNSQVESEYTTTFRLQISTYLTNAFILSLNRSVLKLLDSDTVNDLSNDSEQFEDGQLTTISISLGEVLSRKDVTKFNDKYGEEHIGHLVFSNSYLFSLSKNISTLYILEELPEEYRAVHSYAVNKLNLDTSALINVKLYTRNGKLSPVYYNFDSENLTLDIIEGLNTDFAVSVYVNRVLYETVKKSMQTDTDFFSNGFLTNMYANIAGTNVLIPVKKFPDKISLNSSSIDKSLRIKTAYGIGYVGLDEKTDIDGYKICVGFENNKPIIRRLIIEK